MTCWRLSYGQISVHSSLQVKQKLKVQNLKRYKGNGRDKKYGTTENLIDSDYRPVNIGID